MIDDISIDQAKKLFINTIRIACNASPTPVVIVVDALDETDIKNSKTRKIFSEVLVDLPWNAKVFISSRVEKVIRDSFALTSIIHGPAYASVRREFHPGGDQVFGTEGGGDNARASYRLLQWGKERMQNLCTQASGLSFGRSR